MKVKMLTLMAGPLGIVIPGTEVDVSQSAGRELIKGKYAVPVEKPKAADTEEKNADKKNGTAGGADNAGGSEAARQN